MNDIQVIKELLKDKLKQVKEISDKVDNQIKEQQEINKDLEAAQKALEKTNEFFSTGKGNIPIPPEDYLKDKTIEELREMIRTTRKKIGDNLAGNKDSNKSLYALLEQLLEETKTRKDKDEAEIKKLKEEKEQLEKDIKDIKTQLEELGIDIDKLGGKVDTSTINTSLIKTKTGSIVAISLSILGVFSVGYWAVNGIKGGLESYKKSREG